MDEFRIHHLGGRRVRHAPSHTIDVLFLLVARGADEVTLTRIAFTPVDFFPRDI